MSRNLMEELHKRGEELARIGTASTMSSSKPGHSQRWAQPAKDSANMPGVVYFSHFSNYGITVYAAHEALSIMQAEVEDLRSEVWKYKPAEQAEKDDAGAKSDVAKQHGGWMPKMAQMIAALWNQEYRYFDKLANQFYFGSQPLQKLVDNKLK